MSDTASLELSKELYHLSKWQGTQNVYLFKQEPTMYDADEWIVSARANVHQDHIPAYDAGYLLRKLPPELTEDRHWLNLSYSLGKGKWVAYYQDMGMSYAEVEDGPENALCALAIALFKEGILPISGRD